MSPLLIVLLRKAWPYLAGAALFAVIWLQHRENASLRDSLATERAARAVAVEANQTQSDAITKLEAAVKQWQEAAAVADDIKAQAAQAADYRAQLDQRATDFHQVKAHETPDCQSFLATDLGARCPAIAGRLRELAADH